MSVGPRRKPRAISKNRISQASWDDHRGVLTVWCAAHPTGRQFGLGDDALARGLMRALAGRVAAFEQGGSLSSSASVAASAEYSRCVLAVLRGNGVTSFDDPALTWTVARQVAAAREQPSYRTCAVALLADAVEAAAHPDDLLRRAVRTLAKAGNQPQPATKERAYAPEETDAIEQAARQVWTEWVTSYKSLLNDVGVPTDDDSWLHLSGDELVAQVTDHAAATDSPVALAVLHRVTTGRADTNHGQRAPGVTSQAACSLGPMRVTTLRLAAALILMTLDNDLGHNPAPLMSMRPEDTQHHGNGVTVTELEKTRHGARYKVVSSSRRIYSFGGVATHLAALTLPDRHRRVQAATTQDEHDAAVLLFRTTQGASPDVAYFTCLLPEGLRFSPRRLRKSALSRQIAAGKPVRLAGASRGQVEVYFTASLPQGLTEDLVADGIDRIVEHADKTLDALGIVNSTLDGDTPATVGSLDRGVATCDTGGTDPDTQARCQRGIMGCFACPSARITRRNAAGLQAAIDLADHVRDHNPEEWDRGPARGLWAFATAALNKLDVTPNAAHVRAAMPIVAVTYTEARG